MGDPLTFFGVSDALDIVWYHGANSKAQTRDALTGYYMMVEGDIMLRLVKKENVLFHHQVWLIRGRAWFIRKQRLFNQS
jgi:hypothetical protein